MTQRTLINQDIERISGRTLPKPPHYYLLMRVRLFYLLSAARKLQPFNLSVSNGFVAESIYLALSGCLLDNRSNCLPSHAMRLRL